MTVSISPACSEGQQEICSDMSLNLARMTHAVKCSACIVSFPSRCPSSHYHYSKNGGGGQQ